RHLGLDRELPPRLHRLEYRRRGHGVRAPGRHHRRAPCPHRQRYRASPPRRRALRHHRRPAPPAHAMSAVEEHLATRRSAGLFDFSFMGLCEFHGKAELQALQTRNLDALVPGQIAYTLLLKKDGAVDIDATVWCLDIERFWLFPGRRERYGGHDASGAFAILALQGPASGRILA